jgi:hypothetical protein
MVTRLILFILMLCGATIPFAQVLHQSSVVQVWSDFKAFGAKVAQTANGEKILAMGGERDSEHFDDLTDKLWRLQRDRASMWLGGVVFLLSAAGLGIEINKARRSHSR